MTGERKKYFRPGVPAAFLSILGIVASATADDFFATRIEPILKQHCFGCHSHESGRMKGGLTLDSRSGWQQGGESGPPIIPGKPHESLLISALRHDGLQMPPAPKEKLSDDTISDFVKWIEEGANDPRTTAPVAAQISADTWSLRPLVRPPLPSNLPADSSETRSPRSASQNPIDVFVEAGHRMAGIDAVPEADARTLIRRVYADLHGLPPTPQETDEFLALIAASNKTLTEHSQPQQPADLKSAQEKIADEIWGRLVDQLLSSPRFGERWARHWLDTIHFADSHGYEHDIGRDNAWRFRDYVIQSMNNDTPWDRFIREQLAADYFFPDQTNLIPALGFLGAGTFDFSTYSTAVDTFDYLDRDDLVTQTMAAFTSTTANCARCHAHKFDPITQEDYYALQAVFSGITKGDLPFDANPATGIERQRWQMVLTAAEQRDSDVLFRPEYDAQISNWISGRSQQSSWEPLQLETFHSTDGATLSRIADGAILAGGTRPDKDTYLISGTLKQSSLTAIRLDVLAHESLPMQGPGRQDNGNLHLSEITLTVFSPDSMTPEVVKFKTASADFDQSGWGSERAIDGDVSTAWGIHPAVGKSHHAVFVTEKALTLPPGTHLSVGLKQLHGGGHLIGAFRVSASSAPPETLMAVPEAVETALDIPDEQRTIEQKTEIAAWVMKRSATEALAAMPVADYVYAAGPSVEIPVGNGKRQLRSLKVPKVVHVLTRGDFGKPEQPVTPGALSVLGHLPPRFQMQDGQPESARRAALADWLAHPDNILTWRSVVNRVWHYHFGRGISDTPSDLGKMGGQPSHPELLDWLAVWFRDEAKGSLKQLHRLILTSRTWRRSSIYNAAAATADAENRLLWRFNRYRLDADCVRDFTMAVSGTLDLTMGGPGVQHFSQGPGRQVTPVLDYTGYNWNQPGATRRSIYRFVWRGMADPFMDALDFPDLGMLSPTRSFSASSLQALTLFNNDFVLSHSALMASRLRKYSEVPEQQIRMAIRQVWNRDATDVELAELSEYVQMHGLEQLCRVLLNSNEFLFVD